MMDKKEQFRKVKEIVAVYLPEDVPKEAISTESNLINELNINSANMVDIVLDVEDTFGIRMENSDMDQMHTIEHALDIIDQKIANKNIYPRSETSDCGIKSEETIPATNDTDITDKETHSGTSI